MSTPIAIGIDLGGTNLRTAVVDREGRIIVKRSEPVDVHGGPDVVIARIVQTIDALLAEAHLPRSDIGGVGLGTPGPLNLREGVIIQAANLPGWKNVPIRDRLRNALQCPVLLENDANAAAYGEFWKGAGRDGSDMVMLTLGTGVGCGVVLDGRLLHGHFDNAAELGHMIVVVDGLPCACGQRGCLEQYASAAGVARRVMAARGENTVIDSAYVAGLARSGDAVCGRIWGEACLYLAVACVNIQHAYNSAAIVFGGGMSVAGDFLLDGVNDHLRRQRWSLADDLPALRLAELGDDAGVIGAAGLAWCAYAT